MKIDNELVRRILRIETAREFKCDTLGLVNTSTPNTLSFLDDRAFLADLEKNSCVTVVFTTVELAMHIPDKTTIVCDDPRFAFYSLQNHVGHSEYERRKSTIDPTARIHSRAYVSEYNVEIGANVLIEANATILADVSIGANTIIRAGAVLGAEGFEHKRTSKGILSVFHDGKLFVGENVEIGANTCVDKGFSFRQTVIGDHTKIDTLVRIGHGVQTGTGCFITACALVAGSVTLKDNVWIGPNASIAPQLIIDDGGFVTLGAVVTKDVGKNQWVSGNFAIPHKKFLSNLKKSLLD